MTIYHECGRYHYGDQQLLRECCITDCVARYRLAARVALTTAHPAYVQWSASWNALTAAEMRQVAREIAGDGDLRCPTETYIVLPPRVRVR